MSSELPTAGASHGLHGERVVVTGATGQLGQFLVSKARAAGAEVIAFARHASGGTIGCDLANSEETRTAIAAAAPTIIIHAAACTDVDGIEREPIRGEVGNHLATANVASAAHGCGAYLVAVSTDMVFPGDGGAPYRESAAPRPVSAYGRSKLAAEKSVLSADPSFAVARTAWLYGGSGKHFPRTVLTILRDRGSVDVVADEFGSPTFAGDLAVGLVALASRRGSGIFHLVNAGTASRYALAVESALAAGLDASMVRPTDTATFLVKYPLPARRPPDSSLENVRAAELGISLRGWRDAVRAYVPTLAAELISQPDVG